MKLERDIPEKCRNSPPPGMYVRATYMEISRLAGKAEELNPNTGCLHPSIQKEPVQRSPTRWSLRKASRPLQTHRRGLSRVSRLRDRPQLRLRADKLPSPNHCVRDVISCWFSKLSLSLSIHPCFFAHDPLPCLVSFPCPCSFLAAPSRFDRRGFPGPDSQGNSRGNRRTSRCVSGSEPRV
jgi:hypothetical protein